MHTCIYIDIERRNRQRLDYARYRVVDRMVLRNRLRSVAAALSIKLGPAMLILLYHLPLLSMLRIPHGSSCG